MNALLLAFGGMQPIVDAPVWVVLLLKITAILTAAWLVHVAIARVNPRWRVVLWRVTAVGLLATPAVAWVLPSLEIRVPQPPVVKKSVVAATSPKIPLSDPCATADSPINWPVDMPETAASNSLPMSVRKPSEAAAPSVAAQPALPTLPQPEATVAAPALFESSPITWPVCLLTVWLGGIVVLGLRLCLGHYQISAVARRATQAPHWVRAECSRVAKAIGCRRSVEVMQSTEVESPFLCGLGRPRLLLPARMCEASYRKDLPGILAHELAHVRSHDIYWNVSLQLISILLWLHPLAWRMRKAHLAACELVSDAVSAGFVGDVTDYCRTLARVAVDVYASLPSAGIAMARTSAIGRRLSALRTRVFHLPLRRRSILCFGFSALLAVSVIGAIQFALAAPPEVEPAVKTEKPEAGQAERPAESAAVADTKPKDDSVRISAVDKDGKPILGASVKLESPHGTIIGKSITLNDKGDVKVTGTEVLTAEPPSKTGGEKQTASLRVRVVDEDGKPLANTRLNVKFIGHEANYKTDAEGRATVVAPGPNRLCLSLIAYPDGYPPMRKWWKNDAGNELIPAEFTFTFARGRTIGGVVQNEHGKPIQGAKLHLSITCKRIEKSQMCLALWETPQVTDAGGRWHLDHVPTDADDIAVGQEHPDYISHAGLVQLSEKERKKIEDRTSVIVMKKGLPVGGTVTDPEGKPVADAVVYLGEWWSPPRETAKTDQQGRYRFGNLPSGGTVLTVVKPGLSPGLRNIYVQPSMSPVDFRLEKGNTLRVRVVDKDGKPLSGIFVTPDSWRKRRVLCDLPIRGRTDAEGRWTWTWAPKDAVKISFDLTGYVNYMSISGRPLAAQEAEHVITMYPALTISGRVVDAETKKPIPQFRVIRGNSLGDGKDAHWDRHETIEAKDGQYKTMITQAFMSGSKEYLVRIEADGYQPAVSRAFKDNEGKVTYDFAMKKGNGLKAQVNLADGSPAAGAEVVIFPEMPNKFYNMATFVKNGRIANRESSALSFTAGADGVVVIPPQDNGFLVVVTHDKGIAQTTSEELKGKNAVASIKLQAWGRLEGIVRRGSKAVPNANLDVYPGDHRGERWGFLNFQEQTEADADGKFVYPKLKPGRWYVRLLPIDKKTYRSASEKDIELPEGKTVSVSLGDEEKVKGSNGRTVVGRINWPDGKPPANAVSPIHAYVELAMPEVPSPPKDIITRGPDAIRAWLNRWWKSDECKAWEKSVKEIRQRMPQPKEFAMKPDGSFQIDDLAPGRYQLRVSGMVKEDLPRLPWAFPAHFNYEGVFSVPATAGDAAGKPLDIGATPISNRKTPLPTAGEVKPPKAMAAGEKSVGSLRDNVELLRYIAATNAENERKIQTWRGKAKVQCRSDFGPNSSGYAFSADVAFVFDRAKRSARWDTTLSKWASIVRGVENPESVPRVLNGMATPRGLYRYGSYESPGNPKAAEPLTLTITGLDSPFRGRLQPHLFDFVPLFYFAHNEPHEEGSPRLLGYLGAGDTAYKAAVRVIRNGDEVTVDTDSGIYKSYYTFNLAQGCNLVAEGTSGFNYSQEYRWSYELCSGVWVPKTWSYRQSQKDPNHPSEQSRTVTFIENIVNEPVVADAFSIKSLGLKRGDTIRDERVDPMNQYPYDDAADIRDLPDLMSPR